MILKDPNKKIVRLYKVPDDTFESDDDEELGDEKDEEKSFM